MTMATTQATRQATRQATHQDARQNAPEQAPPAAPFRWRRLVWPAVAVLTAVVVMLPADLLPAWAVKYPAAWHLPLAAWISDVMKWLMNSASFGLFTVRDLTRALSAVLNIPLTMAKAIFATGVMQGEGSQAVQLFPPIPWFSLVIAATTVSYAIGGLRLALGMALGLAYLAVFGQWTSAMVTFASVLVSSIIGAIGGLLLGLACVRSRTLERLISPLLDVAQTMPVFAYLLPMLILFGFGPVSAMIATIIYAVPPMVRITIVAIRAVPEEIEALGRMTGCTRHQITWKMLVPSAMPALMVGVNQVIMLSLNVVIIASMIGAGGLGWDVLAALRRLDIGGGLEAGLAITVLAILLDRFAQALAFNARRNRRAEHSRRRVRHAVYAALVLAAAGWLAAAHWPTIAPYPEGWRLSTAPFWGDLVSWININFNGPLDAVKTFILLNILAPVKQFMLALPWPWVVAVTALAGYWLGGVRLALTVGLMCAFMAVVGLWPATMITVYLCGVAVMISVLIGVPVGIACAQRPALRTVVEWIIDTLQTLPAFVYLIPIVMLFRVGDFTALIAIVLYAIAPAIRYTAHGVAQVSPHLIEAGVMSGCTRRQILTRIRLPLAVPDMLLGLNQTILLALSMLVITALVGTRDLGQVTYAALAKADVGLGLVAGLSVAFIGMIADRLIAAGSARLKARNGH
ncbi:ABC transporter permease [Xanthobacter agilis]|uniref:Glycine betaine/proline transport system permease protein n=1 Tax=Xanthobacter agilis TaxID=47492 RepID=A0ABU0L9F5_XANAG|nr:ABC transporter permease subunit [Xanthobacter agilis]MDQ0503773.1 glycine betaine/proline transport system permease protein [Xanthobacter agilis]